MKYKGQTEYDHKGPSPRTGVLLCNLGTPDAPKTAELRRYLKEFLSDPRVVEVPRLLWWMILNLIILRIRPRRSAKLYQTVWSEEGSPLLVHSKAQVAGVKKILDEKFNDDVPVALGMRYGNPSIESAIAELTEKMFAISPCCPSIPSIPVPPPALPLMQWLKPSPRPAGFRSCTLLAAITRPRLY